jgi:hypothetical protein
MQEVVQKHIKVLTHSLTYSLTHLTTYSLTHSHKVSFETNYLLLCSKLMYCLRKAIEANKWEPLHVYCGDLSMEELMDPAFIWLADSVEDVQAVVKAIIDLGKYEVMVLTPSPNHLLTPWPNHLLTPSPRRYRRSTPFLTTT